MRQKQINKQMFTSEQYFTLKNFSLSCSLSTAKKASSFSIFGLITSHCELGSTGGTKLRSMFLNAVSCLRRCKYSPLNLKKKSYTGKFWRKFHVIHKRKSYQYFRHFITKFRHFIFFTRIRSVSSRQLSRFLFSIFLCLL